MALDHPRSPRPELKILHVGGRRLPVVTLLLALSGAVGPDGLAAQTPGDLLLSGATLIDGRGGPPIPDARLVVEAGRITCVSGADGCPTNPGMQVLDLSGRWLVPGLVDSHVHLDLDGDREGGLRAQALRFAMGITLVRDAGSLQLTTIVEERLAAEAPDVLRPRMVAAGRPASEWEERLGVPRGPEMVRRLVEAGAEAIKVKGLDDDIWLDEMREARALGVPVFGHTWAGPPPTDLTTEAILAGVSGVSHLMGVGLSAVSEELRQDYPEPNTNEFYAWRKNLWTLADDEVLEARIEEMVGAGVWLEPLLVSEFYWATPFRAPKQFDFLRLRPRSLGEVLRGYDELDEPRRASYPEAYARQADFVLRFVEAGGTVLAGGEGWRPGLDLHEEFRLLRAAGVGPAVALRAVTSDAALALGRSDLGALEVGRWADAVVLTADPLSPETDRLDVEWVVKAGVAHRSEDLLRPFRDAYADRLREIWVSRVLRLGLLGLAAMAFLALATLGLRRLRLRS